MSRSARMLPKEHQSGKGKYLPLLAAPFGFNRPFERIDTRQEIRFVTPLLLIKNKVRLIRTL